MKLLPSNTWNSVCQWAKSVEYKIIWISSNQIKKDSYIIEKTHCDDDGENRKNCRVCDYLALDSYYYNHLKSQAPMKNIRKRQHLNNKTIQQHNKFFYFRYYYEMNDKTIFLEDYVNYVDSAKTQITYFKKFKILFSIYISFLIFFLLFTHLKVKNFSVEQMSNTGNLYSNLILRQSKLDLVAKVYGN